MDGWSIGEKRDFFINAIPNWHPLYSFQF